MPSRLWPVLLFSAPLFARAEPPPLPPLLTLQDALRIAKQHNRTLLQTGLEIQQAQEGMAAAKTKLLPQLQISALGGELVSPFNISLAAGVLGPDSNGVPLPQKRVNIFSVNSVYAAASLTIAQPLTQIPLIRAGIALKNIGVQLAQQQQRQESLTLGDQVRQNYAAVLQADNGAKAEEKALQALQELEDTVAKQVQAQAALPGDLLEVQAQEAKERRTLLVLQDTEDTYREQLNLLLGRDISTPFTVTAGDKESAPPPNTSVLTGQALQGRPDLKQAALLVQQADIERHSKMLEYLPAVSLATTYFQLGSGNSGLPSHVWTVGFQFTWDPFDWGERRREADLLREQAKLAQSRLQDARAAAEIEVESDARKVQEAEAGRTAALAELAAAREDFRVTMNRYKAGTALLKDALQAESTLAQAERDKADAALTLLVARADLQKASGQE